MPISLHELNSRVARQTVNYFLITALTPLLLLSIITHYYMSEELQHQSEEFMRQEAKSIGMSIFDHLSFVKEELNINTDQSLDVNKAHNDVKIAERLIDSLLINNVFKFKSTGEIVSYGTEVIPFHSSELLKYIEQKKTLKKSVILSFQSEPPGKLPYLYLIAPIDASSSDSEFIGLELNTHKILDVTAIDGQSNLICILSETGLPLYCNNKPDTAWLSSVVAETEHAGSDFYHWQAGKKELYTAYWSIFLESQFQEESWIIAVTNDENPAIQSMTMIRSTLLIVVLFISFCVILVSLPIIRKRVLPLEKILVSTRKLALGNFDSKISINSGNEFQEISEAINSMSEKLGLQFEHQKLQSNFGSRMLNVESINTIFRSIYEQLIQLKDISGIGIIHFDEDETGTNMFISPIGTKFNPVSYEPLGYMDKNNSLNRVWSGLGKSMILKFPFLAIFHPKANTLYSLVPTMMDGNIIAIIAVELKTDERNTIPLLEQVGVITSKTLSNFILSRGIKFQANHDSLTNLANRNLFNDRLDHSIAIAKRDKTIFAVLFLDLNRFKEINDSLGHFIGDELLKIVAKRLESTLRSQDTVARLGGDEFIFIAESLNSPEDAAVLAEKLESVIDKPYSCQGHELYVTGSIGISLYPQDGIDSGTLVRNADTAMYRAKEEGVNSFQFYSTDMTERAVERLQIGKNLRHAINNSEFLLHYQPQYNLSTGKMTGLEALIRWEHPSIGTISPFHFIPIAEESGLIIEIGTWVLKTACQQICAWKKEQLVSGRVAVNLSVKQLLQSDMVDTVKEILADTGCHPEWLELEITEGCLVTDPKSVIKKLKQLRAMDIDVAIDDFGTGFSSLSYLKNLPITKLKIDKSFVDELANKKEDVAIVKTIIALGKSLNLKTIAEGVETESQKIILESEGCEEVQGYLYSKPQSVEKLMERWSTEKDSINKLTS